MGPGLAIVKDEQKAKAIEDSLSWLRNNDPELEDVDESTLVAFSKMAGIPLPKKLTPKNKKKTMESAIDWLRDTDSEELQNIDEPTLQALTELAGIPMPGPSKI